MIIDKNTAYFLASNNDFHLIPAASPELEKNMQQLSTYFTKITEAAEIARLNLTGFSERLGQRVGNFIVRRRLNAYGNPTNSFDITEIKGEL